MHSTIFSFKPVRFLFGPPSKLILDLQGWRVEGELPMGRCVVIGAPHTSNWDFMLMLLFFFGYGITAYWMGKHTLFRWPTGVLFRWLGGIPVDRAQSSNVVEASIEALKKNEGMRLLLAPEGTRKRVDRWRTGFYHIAVGAEAPICMVSADFAKRLIRFSAPYRPTGDIDSDMLEIRSYFSGVRGKNPTGG